MLQLLPYAMAAYGGYRGYRGARDSGASGIGRILGGITGATAGYYGGQGILGGGSALGIPGFSAAQSNFIPFSQMGNKFSALRGLPFQQASLPTSSNVDAYKNAAFDNSKQGSNLLDILKRQSTREGAKPGELEYSPGKVSAAIAGATYLSGAFDSQPTDIYTPGYNMSYLALRDNRPGYTYIDPTTGEEKAYEKVYAPEEQGLGDRRIGPYSMNVQRLRVGGIAQVKKFNEGGVNYLPSKVSHDENDANNYVRASGYVEDGAGVGNKDEDTMLAQLADGEFVTRADGVLGAGIIAGANPNSMKDMREKGAQYFYEQQKRYKRVFDLLQDRNGNSKQKTN
jgi:hypothetical protein